MWRAVLRNPLKERFPSLRSIITSTLGRSEKENVHLHNLDIGINEDSSSSTRDLKILFKEHFPSLKSIIASTFGRSGKENPHLRNLNIREDDDSSTSSIIKSLEKELEKVRSELKNLKQNEIIDCYVVTQDGIFYVPPLEYCREAFNIFHQLLESKIESKGEDFLNVDSEPWDIFDKLDMEELLQKYPLLKDYDYVDLIGLRILLLQKCEKIEASYNGEIDCLDCVEDLDQRSEMLEMIAGRQKIWEGKLSLTKEWYRRIISLDFDSPKITFEEMLSGRAYFRRKFGSRYQEDVQDLDSKREAVGL